MANVKSVLPDYIVITDVSLENMEMRVSEM
jgi:hypothetical protein